MALRISWHFFCYFYLFLGGLLGRIFSILVDRNSSVITLYSSYMLFGGTAIRKGVSKMMSEGGSYMANKGIRGSYGV